MRSQGFKKITGAILLSAFLLISATAVTADTTITKPYVAHPLPHDHNIPSTSNRPVTGFDDVIWDMIQDETWDTTEYREVTVDISSYTGDPYPVEIAWRYVGINGQSFGLDDIHITADSTPVISEGFEQGLMPPTSWTLIRTNPVENWIIVTAEGYPNYIHSGNYAAWVNYDETNPSDEWLITPGIDLSTATTASITFWAYSDTQWPGATLELHILGGVQDLTPPVTTISLNGTQSGSNYFPPVTVTLTATDDISGVNVTMYRIDSGEFTTYAAPFVVSAIGTHTITYYSVDNAGNKESDKTSTFTIESPIQITITGGLGITATLKNIGPTNISGVDWTIALNGGLIILGKNKGDTITSLAPGEEVNVKDFVLGLGKTTITVTANDGTGKATGTVLLFLVLGIA